MKNQRMEKQEIIRKLAECQGRINELEALGAKDEEGLLEAKTIFEDLFEVSPEALFLVNRQRLITRMNAQAEKLFGYTRRELIGTDHGILVPDRFKAKHDTEMKQYMDQPRVRVMGIGLELSGRRKDGTEFPADIDLGPLEIKKELFVLAVVRDATKRKALEDELVESERRFRTTIDSMLEGCVIIDFHWRYLYVNDAAVKLGQRTKEERLGHTLMEVFPGIEKQDTFAHLHKCMSERVPEHYETEFTFPEGNKVWFEVRAEPVPEGMLILYEDVTQRKKFQDELNKYKLRLEQTVAERTVEFARTSEKLTLEIGEHKRSEEGLVLRASILDNAMEVIILINPEGNVVYANEAAIKTYGYSHDEFLSLNLKQLLRAGEAPIIPVRLKEIMRTGQMELETIHLRKNKLAMPVQVRYSVIKTTHGQFIVSVVRDMTDEFKLRVLLETMPGILWATDKRLILMMSKGMGLETAGLKRDEGTGTPFSEYLEKNGFGTEAVAAYQQALSGTSSSFVIKNKKSGRTFYGWAAPLTEAQGPNAGIISIAVDATDIIKASK